MLFGEKLRMLRMSAHMSQTELAKRLNVSLRTIQNYESGRSYPKQGEIYTKIAELFDVSADFLITDSDRYIMNAEDKNGRAAVREVKELVSEIGGIFAGDDVSEEDKEKIMRTINELYWKAKDGRKNREPDEAGGPDAETEETESE